MIGHQFGSGVGEVKVSTGISRYGAYALKVYLKLDVTGFILCSLTY